ncbi:MAG TPA: putative Ig domain-containing protein [Steroidobacteraceae bacterium]
MHYFQRRHAALLARYFLCISLATVLSACGGSGDSSDPISNPSGAAPPTSTPQITNPPSITGTPVTAIVAGTKYSFQPSASDTDGEALTFSIQNIPSWATFDTTSGLLTGTPTASNVGSYQSITISVADGKAIADLPPFTIQVTAAVSTPPPDTPPTITGTPSTSVQAGSHYAFQPAASDANGDSLVFSITGKPSWASFSTATGLLSGTPASSNVGNFSNIVISVSDGTKSVALASFTITVTAIPPAPPTNTPPKITGTPATTVQAGAQYSFQPAASDADGNTLTFAISNKPSWATFSTTTGQLSGTPATTNVGTYSNIVISVSDGKTSVSLPTFSIQVTAPPAIPPTISGTPPTQAQAGKAYSFTPTAKDPNGKTMSFSVQNKPSWASFSIATGQLSGSPGNADVGTDANIVITVSDGTTSAALAAFTITVAAAPTPPQTQSTATLKWAAPTQNTNGTPITNLSGYVVAYGNSASSLSQTVSITNPATLSYTVQNLGTGIWNFAVSSTESDGTVSALSTVVSKTIQ